MQIIDVEKKDRIKFLQNLGMPQRLAKTLLFTNSNDVLLRKVTDQKYRVLLEYCIGHSVHIQEFTRKNGKLILPHGRGRIKYYLTYHCL